MKKTTIYRRPLDENLFEEELTIEALSAMAIGSQSATLGLKGQNNYQ